MPLWKFTSLAEPERPLASLPTTPEASLGSALALLTLTEGARRQVRTTRAGLSRSPPIAAAQPTASASHGRSDELRMTRPERRRTGCHRDVASSTSPAAGDRRRPPLPGAALRQHARGGARRRRLAARAQGGGPAPAVRGAARLVPRALPQGGLRRRRGRRPARRPFLRRSLGARGAYRRHQPAARPPWSGAGRRATGGALRAGRRRGPGGERPRRARPPGAHPPS